MNSANQYTDAIPIAACADGKRDANGGGKYSSFQLAQKYIRYYLTAANGKGHGIHSPFVYDFVRRVLNDRRPFAAYAAVEALRGRLLQDRTLLEVEDMGAGSAISGTRQRRICDIARHAAKSKKLGQLLYRIALYYAPKSVLELGTSLGLSTAYLSMGVKDGDGRVGMKDEEGRVRMKEGGERLRMEDVDGRVGMKDGNERVWTIEGAGAVAAVAAKNLQSLGCDNAELIVGNFDDRIGDVLDRTGGVELAFIDGNHRLEPTLRYFNLLMSRTPRSCIMIFDDIHWSQEMEEAWDTIRLDPRVYLTIDLFFIGLVVLRDEFKVKQAFTIRF